jgi:hypothetical protein
MRLNKYVISVFALKNIKKEGLRIEGYFLGSNKLELNNSSKANQKM